MNILQKRASGVLMHISSLPGTGGIGTVGKEAYAFVDALHDAGQTYWQILPICPTGYGDSPYQSFSTFAGNPYFIDLDLLCGQGLLSAADYATEDWGADEARVDYGLLYQKRHALFARVQRNFERDIPVGFASFCTQNAYWLDDYALFMAIKDAHGGAAFSGWEQDIRMRTAEALATWSRTCAERVRYYKMLQYLFFSQWQALKDYANRKGVRIIGDIPIYVSADSADVWASPRYFSLSADRKPLLVAGCPPDGFSADGQLWGNPVYDWSALRASGYEWWLRRLEYSLRIYDVLRIDHFRGFESFYCIPAGFTSARGGTWKPGPGLELFAKFRERAGDVSVIAEDLGFLTDGVRRLVRESGFPGMKVLQFAFDSREQSDYLPEHYDENCVVYTGTHDNDTLRGWVAHSRPEDVKVALSYYNLTDSSTLPKCMMRSALQSKANTCILTMQDVLGLDGTARMNTPSTLGGNWTWRATRAQLAAADWQWLLHATQDSARAPETSRQATTLSA